MRRRPWWDKPAWTRHVATTPADPAARPPQERCGLSAAEQSMWSRTTAFEGCDMDDRFRAVLDRQQRIEAPQPEPEGRNPVAWVFAGCSVFLLICILIGELP